MTEHDTSPPRGLVSEPNYNRVLEFYIDDASGDLDLVGLVAYALYKRQKRDWLVKHLRDHDETRPSSAEVAAITNHFLTDDVRNTLRERAADLLSAYAEIYVEALEPQIKQEAVNNETLRQALSIEQAIRSNSGYWRQVTTGLVATALWTLLVTALVVATYFLGSDIIDAWVSSRALPR